MGKLVMVNASGVVISGGGSWDSTACPYTIPAALRPAEGLSTGGISRDSALSTLMHVQADGKVSISNAGGAGRANAARFASLTYVAA